MTLAVRITCQESVGILERTDIVDFCLDWEVKWSWIYRPHAVSADRGLNATVTV